MGLYRAQVKIPRDTADTADDVVNTFHFKTASWGTAEAESAAIVAKLTTFYQTIDSQMPQEVLSPSATITTYNMEDPPERVPIEETALALTLGSGQTLPEEVATCLSYRQDATSGDNPRRQRGRIYIGPLLASNGTTAGGRFTVAAFWRTMLVNAAVALGSADLDTGVIWSVFSPTTAGSGTPTAAAFKTITTVWVDDAWDIQRRRGPLPQVRTEGNPVYT